MHQVSLLTLPFNSVNSHLLFLSKEFPDSFTYSWFFLRPGFYRIVVVCRFITFIVPAFSEFFVLLRKQFLKQPQVLLVHGAVHGICERSIQQRKAAVLQGGKL